jgi:Flp pilus assembly CpaE family ATPase
MSTQLLSAADGAAWEEPLIASFAGGHAHGVEIVRRCVDVIELLAVAATGQAHAALVDARLRRLDADAVDRLTAAQVVVVGVTGADQRADEELMVSLGVRHLVPFDASAEVVASVVAVALTNRGSDEPVASRAFADPTASMSAFSGSVAIGSADSQSADPSESETRGSLIAVWGPTGAPGRSTLAVTLSDELARLGYSALLVDADVYGGSIASMLGLLDDAPGIAAACRQAQSRRLDLIGLAELCFQLRPTLRVLTGLTRADRWPELRVTAVSEVLRVARSLSQFTVVDVGFCLESDEELSFDTLAPRRNGATLAVLDEADLILVVAAADPLGMQRLVRALTELSDAEVSAPVWIVLNRVRKTVVPGDPAEELARALLRFTGRSATALLPYDRAALDAALALGQTLGEAAPASDLRGSVGELAAMVAGVKVPSRGKRRRR